MSKLVIIDYKKGGNIFSVNNSLESLGACPQISSDPEQVLAADKIVFPGVGSFAVAIESLQELGIYDSLIQKIRNDCPVLAICVGMQVLFRTSSEQGLRLETGSSKGFGIIPADVTKFNEQEGLKIPHMGWNSVHNQNPANPLFKGIEQDSHFYFVHSYRVEDQKLTGYSKATTNYGGEFISHIWNERKLFATQFHPEKSGKNGLKLLSNFVKL